MRIHTADLSKVDPEEYNFAAFAILFFITSFSSKIGDLLVTRQYNIFIIGNKAEWFKSSGASSSNSR